jgi:hypothetical protein
MGKLPTCCYSIIRLISEKQFGFCKYHHLARQQVLIPEECSFKISTVNFLSPSV